MALCRDMRLAEAMAFATRQDIVGLLNRDRAFRSMLLTRGPARDYFIFARRPHTDDMMQMLVDLGIDPPPPRALRRYDDTINFDFQITQTRVVAR